jgi:hypothetical protein
MIPTSNDPDPPTLIRLGRGRLGSMSRPFALT